MVWFELHLFFNLYFNILSSIRSGTVESRIRQLVMKLEYVEALTLAHPFIKGFDQIHYCLGDEEVRACASGEVPEAVSKRKKADTEGKEGASTVYTTSFYIGLAIEPKQRAFWSIKTVLQSLCSLLLAGAKAGATGPRRLDISYPTTEFTKLVKVWEKYDESSMGIIVRHIKRWVIGLWIPNIWLLLVRATWRDKIWSSLSALLYPTMFSMKVKGNLNQLWSVRRRTR